MKTPLNRIKLQKKELNSIVKDFFQDQFSTLLIFIGSIPVFIEYFDLVTPPILIKDYIKLINLLILLVCSLGIIFIYSERYYLSKIFKKEAIITSLLMIIIGIVNFFLFIESSLKLNTSTIDVIKKNCDNNGAIFNTLVKEFPATISINIINFFFFSLILLLLFVLFYSFYFLLNILLNKKNTDITHELEKEDVELEQKEEVLNENNDNTTNEKNRQRKSKIIVIKKIFDRIYFGAGLVIILTGISLIVYLLHQYFYVKTSTFTIPTTSFKIFNLITFLISYPSILVGTVILINIVYVPFEMKHNFYQNINWLSEEFYEYIRDITESLVEFEEWNDSKRKNITQSYLLKNKSSYNYNKERSEQLFYWKLMNAKLNFYANRIKDLADEQKTILYASGGLTDEVLNFIKDDPTLTTAFNAVSYKDLYFWVQRGQEYLRQNKELIRSGVAIKRIFLIDNIDDFQIEDKTDFIKIIRMLFEQIQYGIVLYIMKKDVIYEFNYNSMASLPDFGVYEKFAVSFFDKPLKVGGRSLRMEFNKETVKHYSQYFKSILDKRTVLGFGQYVKENIFSNDEGSLSSLENILKEKYKNFFENVWDKDNNEISIDNIADKEKKKHLLYEFQYPFITNLRVLTFFHFVYYNFFISYSKKEVLRNLITAYFKWSKEFYSSYLPQEILFKNENNDKKYNDLIERFKEYGFKKTESEDRLNQLKEEKDIILKMEKIFLEKFIKYDGELESNITENKKIITEIFNENGVNKLAYNDFTVEETS